MRVCGGGAVNRVRCRLRQGIGRGCNGSGSSPSSPPPGRDGQKGTRTPRTETGGSVPVTSAAAGTSACARCPRRVTRPVPRTRH